MKKQKNSQKTSDNLIFIERTSDLVKEIKENYSNSSLKNVIRKKSSISRRSFSDISKLLTTFKSQDDFSGTRQYETKLERMINTLTKTKNKLIFYQDIPLAEDMTW